MLQFLFISLAHAWFPGLRNMPNWNAQGLLWVILFHAGVTEPVYYWMHRAFHTDSLYKKYHSLHHLSVVPEPPTGNLPPLSKCLERNVEWNSTLKYITKVPHNVLPYWMTAVGSDWKCRICYHHVRAGAPVYSGVYSHCGSGSHGHRLHGFSFRVCAHFWLPQMLGSQQCWVCASLVPKPPWGEVPAIHTLVSACPWFSSN